MRFLIHATLIAGLIAGLGAATHAAAAASAVIPLYPRGAIETSTIPERSADIFQSGETAVLNVTTPTLEVFLPESGKANGSAVIVAPGGGFFSLSYANEGTAVAQRLAGEGVAAFVLKYRLARTPEDPKALQAQIAKTLGPVVMRNASGKPDELPRFPAEELAAADAAQAVKLVRGQAARWGVDPERIGFVGFSAGAFTAANVAIGDPSARPDFVGLIYGGLRTPVPKDAPPAFIATAADDPLLPNDGLLLYRAWREAGRPAELHQYERGGHGFGIKPKGATSDHWIDEFVWWMGARGYLGRD